MILKELKIDTWIGDPTNCYIILDEKSKELMVIDPAGDVDKIQEMIKILDGKLKYIYLTHCHGDHIFGVTELKKNCGGKILIHRMDAEGLNDAAINLTPYIREENIELEADSRIDDEDLIHFILQDILKVEHAYTVKRKIVCSLEILYLEVHGEELMYQQEV